MSIDDLYKNFDIQNIDDRKQFLLNYLQGNIFANIVDTVSFIVEP
jgi:hypothetical protein